LVNRPFTVISEKYPIVRETGGFISKRRQLIECVEQGKRIARKSQASRHKQHFDSSIRLPLNANLMQAQKCWFQPD